MGHQGRRIKSLEAFCRHIGFFAVKFGAFIVISYGVEKTDDFSTHAWVPPWFLNMIFEQKSLIEDKDVVLEKDQILEHTMNLNMFFLF